MFCHSKPEVVEILNNLLQFNPYFRLNASDCLKHPIFDSIRNPLMERPAPYQIYLKVDQPEYFENKSTQEELFSDFRNIIMSEMKEISTWRQQMK
jgi:serine/threonine protein kinase